MKNLITKYLIVLFGVFYLNFSGCSDSPIEPEPSNMVDSGSWYETGLHYGRTTAIRTRARISSFTVTRQVLKPGILRRI
ncbi:MAG: hypothetical protein ACE5I1_21690, partial [bacterium]